MKLSLMVIMLSLLSCGGGKDSQVSLKISSSMMLSNGGFPGGLVVQGKGPNGITFSRFLSYHAGSNTMINITLPKGVWTFDSVGFDGGATSASFEGNTKCGLTGPLDLFNNSTQVELILDSTKCADTHFASKQYSSSNQFKKLSVVTCSQFLKNDAGEEVSNTATNDQDFCRSASPLKSSAKIWAKSMRISPIIKELDGHWSASIPDSTCLMQNIEGIVTSHRNIPTQAMPLQIDLYSDEKCGHDKLMVSYPFPHGLEYDYLSDLDKDTKQEKILLSNSSDNYLFLSTNKTKRGTSSFYDLMPSIKCGIGDGKCATEPILASTGGVAYAIGVPKSRFVLAEKTALQNCSTLTWAPDTSSENTNLILANTRCIDEDNGEVNERKGLVVEIDYNTTINSCSTSYCTFSYHFKAGDPYQTIKVRNDPSSLPKIFEGIHRAIGHMRTSPIFDGQAQNIISLSQSNSDYGRLGKVRELFHPSGPAGILGNLTCNRQVDNTEIINFREWENGAESSATYQVSVIGKDRIGTTLPIPPYICHPTNATGTCPADSEYDVQMKVEYLDGVTWKTESIIKLDCQRKIGQVEKQEVRDGKTEKERIFWNNEDPLRSRYEYYSSSSELDLTTNSIIRKNTEYERTERLSGDNVSIKSYSYHGEKNSGTGYRQDLSYRIIDIIPGTISVTMKDGNLSSYSTIEMDDTVISNYGTNYQPIKCYSTDAPFVMNNGYTTTCSHLSQSNAVSILTNADIQISDLKPINMETYFTTPSDFNN